MKLIKNDEMTTLDFMVSEYNWCIAQYERLQYISYMLRAMDMELMINQYNQNSKDEFTTAETISKAA
jgi:hypothetical protein